MIDDDKPNKNEQDNNPFTDHSSSDFNTDFNTQSDEMSELFTGNSFFNENKNRIIMVVIILLAGIGFGAFYYYTTPTTDDSDIAATTKDPQEEDPTQQLTTDSNKDSLADAKDSSPTTLGELSDSNVSSTQSALQSTPAIGVPKLISPKNGQTRYYDDSSQPALFKWQSSTEQSVVEFSRSAKMKPLAFKVKTNDSTYTFRRPYPGKWYWRTSNEHGTSATWSFEIKPPVKRKVIINTPTAGGTLSSTDGIVTWQGDTRITYYHVELSADNTWVQPQYKFATSGTALKLTNVSKGQYYLRVGAFSEISGRWEYTQPIMVTIK